MLVALVVLVVGAARLLPPSPTRSDHDAPDTAIPISERSTMVAVPADRERQLASFVRRNCSLCHGTEGSLGPFLSPANLQHLSENAITLTILHGRQKGMPAWETELSAADARWIAGYLKRGGFTR